MKRNTKTAIVRGVVGKHRASSMPAHHMKTQFGRKCLGAQRSRIPHHERRSCSDAVSACYASFLQIVLLFKERGWLPSRDADVLGRPCAPVRSVLTTFVNEAVVVVFVHSAQLLSLYCTRIPCTMPLYLWCGADTRIPADSCAFMSRKVQAVF